MYLGKLPRFTKRLRKLAKVALSPAYAAHRIVYKKVQKPILNRVVRTAKSVVHIALPQVKIKKQDQEPVYDAPVAQEPVYDAPVAQEPAYDAPAESEDDVDDVDDADEPEEGIAGLGKINWKGVRKNIRKAAIIGAVVGGAVYGAPLLKAALMKAKGLRSPAEQAAVDAAAKAANPQASGQATPEQEAALRVAAESSALNLGSIPPVYLLGGVGALVVVVLLLRR